MDSEKYVYHVKTTTFSVKQLQELSEHDDEIQKIKKGLKSGIWEPEVNCYRFFEVEICEFEGILLRGTKLIPPKSIRAKILEIAHEGHLGMSSMKNRLRAAVWWSNMEKDVERFVSQCRSCILVSAPNPPQPMARKVLPLKPWEDLAVDFLGPIGGTKDYVLVVVDYYSRFCELAFIKQPSTTNTTLAFRAMIGRNGFPRTLTSDNGPQFHSEEFKLFCQEEGITLNLTTPYWPQANGEVERQNRNLKRRIMISIAEGRDWKSDLLVYQSAYHASPHRVTGKPPGVLFHGSYRDKLPSIGGDLERNDEEVRDQDMIQKMKGKEYGDRKRRAKESDMGVGETVVPMKMQKRSKFETNFEPEEHTIIKRSGGEVVVQNNDTGIQYRRHVSHLKRVASSGPIIEPENQLMAEPPRKRPMRITKRPDYFRNFVNK